LRRDANPKRERKSGRKRPRWGDLDHTDRQHENAKEWSTISNKETQKDDHQDPDSNSNELPQVKLSKIQNGVNFTQATSNTTKDKRRQGCGKCMECCTAQDCGTCRYCRDKRKFGGKNTLRKKCERRVCRQGDPVVHTVKQIPRSKIEEDVLLDGFDATRESWGKKFAKNEVNMAVLAISQANALTAYACAQGHDLQDVLRGNDLSGEIGK
jgi:hypothetical protein